MYSYMLSPLQQGNYLCEKQHFRLLSHIPGTIKSQGQASALNKKKDGSAIWHVLMMKPWSIISSDTIVLVLNLYNTKWLSNVKGLNVILNSDKDV